MNIELEGMKEVLDSLENLGKIDSIEQAMNEACMIVEREAKTLCPVQTGGLRASITSNVDKSGNQVVGQVFTPLQYANYVEYGTGLFAARGNGRQNVPWFYFDAQGKGHATKGQHPQPFMIPALNNNRKQILDILDGGIGKNG